MIFTGVNYLFHTFYFMDLSKKTDLLISAGDNLGSKPCWYESQIMLCQC